MTLVGDGMARPGGGEGPNHLWNHLNSQSPPTHRCHILEATLCPTKLVKQPQYIFHKRIQQQINNYKSPLKLEYSFTIFLSNLDDTKGSCQKRFSGFCPLRGYPPTMGQNHSFWLLKTSLIFQGISWDLDVDLLNHITQKNPVINQKIL